MGVEIQISSDAAAVEFWWKQVRRYHRLFFRLIDEKPEALRYIPNVELCINVLEHSYMQLIRLSYPQDAEIIRTHLLSATRNLIDCLRRYRKAQLRESTMLLNMAGSDMVLLRFELMGLGIFR